MLLQQFLFPLRFSVVRCVAPSPFLLQVREAKYSQPFLSLSFKIIAALSLTLSFFLGEGAIFWQRSNFGGFTSATRQMVHDHTDVSQEETFVEINSGMFF